MAGKGWLREFDDPIALPDGKKLATLHDAATYGTTEERIGGNGRPQSDVGRRARQTHDPGADRVYAGIEPAQGSRVQSEPERPPLGQAQAEARSMKRGGSDLARARYQRQKRG
jgi:hypothetical protein